MSFTFSGSLLADLPAVLALCVFVMLKFRRNWWWGIIGHCGNFAHITPSSFLQQNTTPKSDTET